MGTLIGRALPRYHRVQGFESHTGFLFATLIDQKTGKSLIGRWMVAMDQQIVGAGRSMEISVIKLRFLLLGIEISVYRGVHCHLFTGVMKH